MPPFFVLVALLTVSVDVITTTHDDDFAFDVYDDIELELSPETLTQEGQWRDKVINANVGEIFSFNLPVQIFGKDVKRYEVRNGLSRGTDPRIALPFLSFQAEV